MKKQIWLINLFGTPCAPSSFNPDNSLAALAATLKASGYQPRIIDFQTLTFCSRLIPPAVGAKLLDIVQSLQDGVDSDSDLERWKVLNQELLEHQRSIIREVAKALAVDARRERPLFIGLKLYSGEGHFLNLELVAELKRLQVQAPIVGGGPLVRVLSENYLRLYPQIDFLLDGEADLSIVKLAEFFEGKIGHEWVDGLVYKDGKTGEVISNPARVVSNLSELPAPCYDEDVYPALYQKDEKAFVFQIDESRGCPNSCHFCIHPIISGRRVRCANPKHLVSHMAELQARFGASAFRFTGSNTPQKLLLGIADELKRTGLKIHYSGYGSVNMTNPAYLNRLMESGLIGIFIGAETLDDHVLEKMFNKPQDSDEVMKLIEICLERGLYTTTSWMYPAPQQGPETRERIFNSITKAYRGYTSDHGSVMVVPSGVIPNTRWFMSAGDFGFSIPDRDRFLRNYAELNFSLHRPRRLMGELGYQHGADNFLTYSAATDSLISDLKARHIPLSITDDWMLMGKLSGLSMDEFKSKSVRSFISGDYDGLRQIVAAINANSRTGYWPRAEEKKRAS